MSDRNIQQPREPFTINDFDRYSAASRCDLPRYRDTIGVIDEVVDRVLEDGSSTDRAAQLGKNLLDMVEAASKRSRVYN